jgi:threonine synthase
MKNVLYGKCVKCGKTYPATPDLTTCECGGILDITYDYDYIKAQLTKEQLAARTERTMWRYRELLPIEETTEPTPLRVGWSPLYEEPRLAAQLGLKRLWVKDDGQNPTASLKDRASAMAVAKAREAGAKVIACSSTGNAASSLAGNAAAAGLKTYIFVPSRAPKGKVAQLMTFGATVISVQGSYEETFELSKQAIDKWGWYNRNAAINPYLSEGKKTVALEIMEQLQWQVPDYIAISVGDGCTIAGLWKGLKDLYAIGFIDRLPRLISAQAAGCCPLNRAIETGEPWHPMEENTLADSIAVGVPRNADKALMAIRESGGLTVNVTDEEIMAPSSCWAGPAACSASRRRHRHGRREEALRAGCHRQGRHCGVRGHRQRPQGRGQRHQGRRGAHLHPLRHGIAAQSLCRARRGGGISRTPGTQERPGAFLKRAARRGRPLSCV